MAAGWGGSGKGWPGLRRVWDCIWLRLGDGDLTAGSGMCLLCAESNWQLARGRVRRGWRRRGLAAAAPAAGGPWAWSWAAAGKGRRRWSGWWMERDLSAETGRLLTA